MSRRTLLLLLLAGVSGGIGADVLRSREARAQSLPPPVSNTGDTISGTVTSTVASGSNAFVCATDGARICLRSDCTTRIAGDGFGQLQFVSGNNYRFASGNVSVDGTVTAGGLLNNGLVMTGGNSAASTITELGSNGLTISTGSTGPLTLGDSTTTRPVKIAGGSGAFVGSCAMSAGTTCTQTVPTGSVCVASARAGTASVSSVNVSSTTVTVTASASNSSTWTIICL